MAKKQFEILQAAYEKAVDIASIKSPLWMYDKTSTARLQALRRQLAEMFDRGNTPFESDPMAKLAYWFAVEMIDHLLDDDDLSIAAESDPKACDWRNPTVYGNIAVRMAQGQAAPAQGQGAPEKVEPRLAWDRMPKPCEREAWDYHLIAWKAGKTTYKEEFDYLKNNHPGFSAPNVKAYAQYVRAALRAGPPNYVQPPPATDEDLEAMDHAHDLGQEEAKRQLNRQSRKSIPKHIAQ